jgi:hypothetical protein
MFVHLVETRRALQDMTQHFDASTLTIADAGRVVAELAVMRRLIDTMFTLASTRAAEDAVGGDRIAARTLGVACGEDPRDVQQAIAAGRRLADLPATQAAARAGKLSARHAALIADAATIDPSAETGLIDAASRGTLALREACIKAKAAAEDPDTRTKRQRRLRTFRTWIDDDGMIAGRFRLQPELGASLIAALDNETRRVFREHRYSGVHEPMDAYAADALCNLITGRPPAPESEPRRENDNDTGTDNDDIDDEIDDEIDDDNDTGTDILDDGTAMVRDDPSDSAAIAGTDPIDTLPIDRPPTPQPPQIQVRTNIHILIDHAALLRGRAWAGETCKIPGVGPVNAQWVQSLLGDAFVTAIIRKGTDICTVAHLGRHIPAVVRTALTVAGLECCVEGCTCRGYLEMDHSNVDFAGGGPTSFPNLDPLCSPDHKLKTQGWILGPRNPTTGKRTLTPPPPIRSG